MKYLSVMILIGLMLFQPLATASAQTFQECADVNQSNSVNISDLSFMMSNILVGEPPLPAGRGDIDFRQNFNLGDLRYLAGYIFLAYPPGGCPPFPSYAMVNTTDTVFLPEAAVPPGSGKLMLPIVIDNDETISELILYSTMLTTNCTAFMDSVTFVNWITPVRTKRITNNELGILWMSFLPDDYPLIPGNRVVAVVHISYSASTGGTVALNPSVLDNRNSHEVFGILTSENYGTMSIGKPNLVVRAASVVPSISVAPDSLYFVALAGSGDPAPQSIDIVSDGDIVDWSATAPPWIQLTPTSGITATTASVQPLTATLSPGTHSGVITVTAPFAYNSPKIVKVVMRIQPQYPAFDANCDGLFNISDIVYLIQYIFGGPAPCDPYGKK